MVNNDSFEIKKILKEALNIVDALGNNDIDEFDKFEIQDLIEKAKKLKKNRLWRLN